MSAFSMRTALDPYLHRNDAIPIGPSNCPLTPFSQSKQARRRARDALLQLEQQRSRRRKSSTSTQNPRPPAPSQVKPGAMSDAAAAKKKNDDIDVPVAKVGEAPKMAAAPARLKRKPYSVKRTHDIVMEGAWGVCVANWVSADRPMV